MFVIYKSIRFDTELWAATTRKVLFFTKNLKISWNETQNVYYCIFLICFLD